MRNQTDLGHTNHSHSIGQSSDISAINETGDRIRNILNLEDLDSYNFQAENFSNLLNKLSGQISITRNKIDFCYNQTLYREKLANSSTQLHEAFSDLLNIHPDLNIIFNQIKTLLSAIPNGDIIIHSIVNDYFEDLIYEYIKVIDYKDSKLKVFSFKSYSDGELVRAQTMKTDNYKKVVIEEFALFQIFKKGIHCWPELVNLLGDNEVKIVDFTEMTFDNYFTNNSKDFIDFTLAMCSNGIKSIDYDAKLLDKVFGNNPQEFIDFIGLVGLAGLRSINLGSNRIFNILGNKINLINFIKTAGESGIKHIDLYHNDLRLFFENDRAGLIEFIKTAGLSGIKSINLGRNNLNIIFTNDIDSLIEFVIIAGKYGIRSLGLESNDLFETIGEVSIANKFLDACKQSGIISIDFERNDISHFKSAIPDINEIVSHLHYGSFN